MRTLSAGPSNFAHHLGKIAFAAAWFVNARAVTAAPVTETGCKEYAQWAPPTDEATLESTSNIQYRNGSEYTMATKKFTAAISTISWIDSKVGLPVKDSDPATITQRAVFTTNANFRFSNFLEAFVIVDDRLGIRQCGFSRASGMYRGPSEFGLQSAVVGKIGRYSAQSSQSATFRQVVGARTQSHEIAGEVGVGGAGAIVGGIGGFMIGGPVGAFVGAVGVCAVGYVTGKELAELIKSFPPIWTELELTINADGSIRRSLLSHSVFPSNTIFGLRKAALGDAVADGYSAFASYDGDLSRLQRWQNSGWDLAAQNRSGPTDGNPWGMKNPAKTIGEKLVQSCPSGYECKAPFL
jgi:hypothetical protein